MSQPLTQLGIFCQSYPGIAESLAIVDVDKETVVVVGDHLGNPARTSCDTGNAKRKGFH